MLSHELGLPHHAKALAAALAFGRTRTLWPGVAEGPDGNRVFVQMLGVGLDAQVVHRVNHRLKRAIGRQAYTLQTLREIGRYDYAPIRVRLDGVDTEVASVVVSKGRFYGGAYTLAPLASSSEPGFSVALFRHNGARAALGYGAALVLDRLGRAHSCELVRAQRVEILGGDQPAQADGDPAGMTPIAVRDADVSLPWWCTEGRLGLCPKPHWGQAPPDPLDLSRGFRGPGPCRDLGQCPDPEKGVCSATGPVTRRRSRVDVRMLRSGEEAEGFRAARAGARA